MSQLETSFAGNPYFDDYNAGEKRFYRILFVPSRAVQTREMNQIQSIVQEQIRRFGNHVFKDGSIVDGCNINQVPNLQYIRLNNGYNVANTNVAFDENLHSMLVVSATSGLRASIRLVKQGYQSQYPDTNVFYVDYINTGHDVANNEVHAFQPGETLTLYNTTQNKLSNTLDPSKIYNTINTFTANVSANQSSTGNTYAVSVGEGVVYQKGFFVNVKPHTITVKPYDTTVDGWLVGFDTQESIINHLQDQSLIDPASTTAQNAPGADRLKLEPVLVSKYKDDVEENDNFFPIITYGEEQPTVQNIDPAYAKLGDIISRNVFEPHGDFYLKPFIVGSDLNANTAKFNYVVNPGIGYVKGNRVELLSALKVSADRATTTDESNASIITINYGNYIYVKELVGVFDFDQLNTINIYDAPQASITDREGSGTGPTGTLIGTASVRSILYEDGVKGTPEATYRLYITDIRMNSGFSFNTHAKSFSSTSGTYGTAKADIVLESSKAVLKDSNKSSLVFDTGIEGLRRLRNSSDVNDTQFYLRDTTSATLQANGSVTFTLNTPHAGGIERFFASTGSLSTGNEAQVDVVTSTAAYSNVFVGTVDSTTTGNNLIGTSTTFLTDYKVGNFTRISANTTSHTIRRVVAIANNTQMTLDAPVAVANTVAEHRKYFTAGAVLDLGAEASVTVNSNTQFTVSLTGLTFESGAPQTVYASYPVFRSQAVEMKKTVKKSRYVKIDCSNNAAGTFGPFDLGLNDVFAIEGVWVGATYSENNPERSAWFTLDNGQVDTHYDHSKLVVKPTFKSQLSSSIKALVKLSYFESDNTTGIGFYSVDSYPVRGPGETANTTNISYAEIPVYNGLDLRNAVDFRPRKFNTAADAAVEGSATINPAASNTSFVVSSSGTYIAQPDSNFQADIEFYLPRIDLIQVNKDGAFNVKSSIPNINPKSPTADQDSMAIATAYVPPYPSLSSAEQSIYGQSVTKIQTNQVGNRTYTMKDIYGLDQRLTRLEYYQTLSLLEAQAKDYTIKDENGLDRFKNGIFADPFNNHFLGNVSNFEYNIAIDPEQSIARPIIEKNDVDLKIGATSNTQVSGQLVSLPYVAKEFITQGYASKFRNVVESVWNWAGDINLFPAYDHFVDEQILPDVNVVIDMASQWQQFANSPFAANYGDWRVTDQAVSSSVANSTTTNGRSTTTNSTTTTTTTNTLSQTVEQLKVTTSQNTYDLGSYVTDFTINPFMRSREVAMMAFGLKPNTKFWVYFDDTPVSQFCAPGNPTSAYNPNTGAITVTEGNESAVIARTAAFGTQLVSTSEGDLFAIFKIPSGQFKVGDRELLIANVDDLVTGSDAITSSVRAVYTASSMTTSKRSATISTIEPKLSTQTTTKTQVSSATSVTQRSSTITTAAQRNPDRTGGGSGSAGNAGGDPLGQSFLIDLPQDVPGIFIDKIGVYFKSKDPTLGINCVLCEMSAGVPDTTKIISKSYLKPSEIGVSANGSVETVFDFQGLPYLSSGTYYAFFLQPDGNSPEYTAWMAEVGGVDIVTGQKIFSNPNIGVAFVSANSNSWNALQTEDVKFKIYRAQFTSLQGQVSFYDQDDDYFTVDGFALANSAVDIQVGDVVYSQNSTGGLIVGNTSPFGVVQYLDNASDILVLDSSRGGFTANTTIQIHRPAQTGNVSAINANTRIATSTIESIDDVRYSIVVPRIGNITPFGTNIGMKFKGMEAGEIVDANFVDVQAETELELIDKMRVVLSKSNRVGVTKSVEFQINMTSPSDYLSPILDLRRRNAFFIRNIINNSVTGEETRYGEASTKYLSQNITLAEGQDAEDIKVFVTGYRPSGSDIHAYVKFLNSEDSTQFEDKLWTKLEMSEGSSTFSSSLDVQDFREFGYSIPTVLGVTGTAFLNANNSGIVQYSNADGSVYTGYKTFAIKLVLTSEREERVPRMRDVRSIALQK